MTAGRDDRDPSLRLPSPTPCPDHSLAIRCPGIGAIDHDRHTTPGTPGVRARRLRAPSPRARIGVGPARWRRGAMERREANRLPIPLRVLRALPVPVSAQRDSRLVEPRAVLVPG